MAFINKADWHNMMKGHPEILTAAIGKEIYEATGKSVIDFQINLTHHEAVSITMTYYPDSEELAKLASVFAKWGRSPFPPKPNPDT